MTNKEKLEDASARLKSQKKYLEYDGWTETYQIAIDCIEKQIPKQPVIENDDCGTLICPNIKFSEYIEGQRQERWIEGER